MRYTGLALILSATVGLTAAGRDLRLVDALKHRDTATARALLKQHVDANAADVDGTTALHWAARWNEAELVKLLIRAGASAKAANRYGVTPLHEASTVGNVTILEALLKADANPNATFGEGETPLMTAARTGNVDAVKMLLSFGADVNAREEFRGQTALMWAAAENHAAVVRLLVELHADVNARSLEFDFPELTGGNGGIIHDRPMGGLTALFFAARQGAIESAQALIEAGASVNVTEPQYGFTPLQTAIFNGHYDLVPVLLDRGARADDGSLYTAIETRNLATYSNRPNPPDTDRKSSSIDAIALLLARGADPNQPYTKRIPPRQAQGDIAVIPGATPLYRAVKATDLAAIRLLMDYGADPSVATKDGSTPLMVAAGLGARRTANEEDVIEKAVRADPVDAARLFVDAGADVNAVNDSGSTALHYAALTGAGRMVEFLASQGAKLDIKNKQGKTPVDLARGSSAATLRKLSRLPQPEPVATDQR